MISRRERDGKLCQRSSGRNSYIAYYIRPNKGGTYPVEERTILLCWRIAKHDGVYTWMWKKRKKSSLIFLGVKHKEEGKSPPPYPRGLAKYSVQGKWYRSIVIRLWKHRRQVFGMTQRENENPYFRDYSIFLHYNYLREENIMFYP